MPDFSNKNSPTHSVSSLRNHSDRAKLCYNCSEMVYTGEPYWYVVNNTNARYNNICKKCCKTETSAIAAVQRMNR